MFCESYEFICVIDILTLTEAHCDCVIEFVCYVIKSVFAVEHDFCLDSVSLSERYLLRFFEHEFALSVPESIYVA